MYNPVVNNEPDAAQAASGPTGLTARDLGYAAAAIISVRLLTNLTDSAYGGMANMLSDFFSKEKKSDNSSTKDTKTTDNKQS